MNDVFSSPTSILHVAPEPAIERRLRRLSNVKYISGDISGIGVDMTIDVCHIPFANDHFDLVICNHVLEHVLDDRTAIQEISRVLKSGGRAILIVPIDFSREHTYEDSTIWSPKERLIHFGQSDHVRIYGLDYFIRLKHSGFQVHRWKSPSLDEYALHPMEEVIVGRKA